MRFQTNSAKLPGEKSRKKHPQMPVADFMLKSRFTSQLANFWSRPLEASIPSSTKKRHSGHIWPFLGEEFVTNLLIYLFPETLRFEMFKNLWCVLIWLAFASDPSSSMHISPGPTNSSFHVVNNDTKVGGPRSPASTEWSLQEPEDLTAVQRALLGMPLVPWDGEDGENQQEIGENQQEVGWFQVSLRRLLKCPKKKDLRWINLGDGKKSCLTILPNKNKVGWSGWVFYNLCIDMLWFSMLEIKVLFRQKGATSRFVSPKHCHPEAPEESLK